jgi:hypothetical protein
MILSYSLIYVFLLCNSEFDAQTWRSNHQPTHKQLDNMRRSGIQGRPNFVTWFKEHALRASNVHPDLCQLSYGYITCRHPEDRIPPHTSSKSRQGAGRASTRCHVSCSFRPHHSAEVGFRATTCPATSNLTSLLR